VSYSGHITLEEKNMNKFSNYVAGIALATMIGCSDQPANQVNSEPSDLEVCTQELATTTGYSGDFAADYNSNVLRPYGAKVDAATTQFCLVARMAFDNINPDKLPLTVSDDLVISIDNANVSGQYLDALISEANDPANNLVSSYLGDVAWAQEFVEAPMDAYVCQQGTQYWRADSADPANTKIRSMYVTGDRLPGMLSARLTGKYGVEDPTNQETVENMATLLGYDLTAKGYVVAAKDCPEDTE